MEARGNIWVALEGRDGDDFHRFCSLVVRDAGEPCGETFSHSDKVLGRPPGRTNVGGPSVRFFTRVPGPPGLRNLQWRLRMRAVKLTLVGVQPAKAAHIRNLLDSEKAGTYDIDTGQLLPLDLINVMFNFDGSDWEREGSLFSQAAARPAYPGGSKAGVRRHERAQAHTTIS